MPRPPKHPHALRTALKILGWTQVELAKRVSCATVTLEQFLNGQASISDQLAIRIAKETGLDIEQLLVNTDPLQPRRNDGTLLKQPPLADAEKRAALRTRERRFDRYLQEAVKASLQAERESVEAGVEKDPFFRASFAIRLSRLIHEHGLTKRTLELLGIPESRSVFWGSEAWAEKRRLNRRRKGKSPKKPKRRTV